MDLAVVMPFRFLVQGTFSENGDSERVQVRMDLFPVKFQLFVLVLW